MFLPHTRRGRRITALAVAVVACATVAVQAAQADDPLNQKHKQLQHQVKSAQAVFDDASSRLVAAQASLARAQKTLDAANAALAKTRAALAAAVKQDDAMKAKLKASQNQLATAQSAVVAARAATEKQREAIGQFAAQTYQAGDPQLMQMLAVIQGGSAAEISSRLGVIDGVVGKQNALYRAYQQQAADLAHKEQTVAAATETLAVQQQATAAAVVRRQTLTQAALQQQRKVEHLVAARSAASRKAAAIMKQDKAKLAALKKQDARIKQQILARKRHDANRSWSGSGMMLRPVNAPITSPYGWRIHPIYHYWGLHDGDDFGASCGQPQVAVDSGTVISEYYSDVWGNRLYLDLGNINGHNYTVIYNHTERYAVRVGQRVSRGQVVAYTGTTGWSTGCHLHFTVLKDGTAVNPAQYF